MNRSAIFYFVAGLWLVASGAQPAQWTVESATNVAGPYTPGPTQDTEQAFARLRVVNPPANTVSAGGMITVPSGSATMSNGTVMVTATAATTNDWTAITNAVGHPNTNVPMILNLGRPQ